LGAFYTPSEKGLDPAEPFGDDDSELAIMRCDFERGIDEKTFFPLAVIDRTFDDVVEELVNGVLGRKRGFQAAKPHPGRMIEIMFQGPREESALVAEGIVQARRRQAHRPTDVAH
jgi:hypothetical protein